MQNSGVASYNVVLLGDGGVGKSALAIMLSQHEFVTEYNPTIEDCFRHQMRVDDANVLLEVMDTAGQEEYSSLRDQYYAKGQGFMVVYSVVARATFDSVVDYQAHIQRAKQDSAFPLVLVGNKADLADARKVTTREGQDLARTYKCPFFETSAMTNTNVEEAFAELARRVRDYRPGAGKKGAVQDSSDYYNGGSKGSGDGKSCCTLL